MTQKPSASQSLNLIKPACFVAVLLNKIFQILLWIFVFFSLHLHLNINWWECGSISKSPISQSANRFREERFSLYLYSQGYNLDEIKMCFSLLITGPDLKMIHPNLVHKCSVYWPDFILGGKKVILFGEL